MASLTSAFINYNLVNFGEQGYRLIFWDREDNPESSHDQPLGGVKAILKRTDRNRCSVMVFYRWNGEKLNTIEQAVSSLKNRLQDIVTNENYLELYCSIVLLSEKNFISRELIELTQLPITKEKKLKIGYIVVEMNHKEISHSLWPKYFPVPDILFPNDELQLETINPSLVQEVKEVQHLYTRTPWFVYILMLFNIVVFAFAFVPDELIYLNSGALISHLVWQGDYWRLFSAMGLHGSVAHLVGNSIGLYLFGSKVEEYFGITRMIIIYLFAGLIGSLACMMWQPLVPCLGASGAIFGLAGALLYLVFRNKNIFKVYLIYFIISATISLIQGALSANVSTAAHLGGFIGGFAVAFVIGIVGDRQELNQLSRQVIVLAITTILTIFVVRPPQSGITKASWDAHYWANQQEYEKAQAVLTQSIVSFPLYQDELQYHRSLIEIQWADYLFKIGEYREAEKHYIAVIEAKKIHSPKIIRNLATVYEKLGQTEAARKYSEQALDMERLVIGSMIFR